MPSGYWKISEQDEEYQPEDFTKLPGLQTSRMRYWNAIQVLRAVVEMALLVSILTFLLSTRHGRHEKSSNLRTMPSFTSRSVLFKGDPRFVSAESFGNKTTLQETLKEWTVLSPKGRGSIIVDPGDRSSLPRPYEIQIPEDERTTSTDTKQEIYMVSVFHQLHCLSSLLSTYGLMVVEGRQPSDLVHDAHCFDFIRQAILCAGDTTVEGSTKYGEGWGAIHQCKDIDAIRAWTEYHAGFEWHKFSDAL
ncbi:hypothetical protein N431DRAFT_481159 [Stipitochalara longipes BDJ]|nr:hypothetical protein N431DRAFT_481159 [Stipitochalara longipes BDJ]